VGVGVAADGAAGPFILGHSGVSRLAKVVEGDKSRVLGIPRHETSIQIIETVEQQSPHTFRERVLRLNMHTVGASSTGSPASIMLVVSDAQVTCILPHRFSKRR